MRIITTQPGAGAAPEIIFMGEDKKEAQAAMDAATHVPAFFIYEAPASRRANPKYKKPNVPRAASPPQSPPTPAGEA
jgi:hypothetical protein